MGRHSQGNNRSRTAGALAAAAVFAATGIGVMTAVNRHNVGAAPSATESSPTPAAAPTTACTSRQSVPVSTTPDMAPVLSQVLPTAERTLCVHYVLTTVAAGIQSDRIGHGHQAPPAVWIPDSPAWVDDLVATSKMPLTFGDVIATSPVGIAIPQALVAQGARTGKHTWTELMTTAHLPIAMSDPEYSTASMLLLTSAQRSAAKDPAANANVQKSIVAMSRNPRHETELMRLATTGSPLAAAFPASEQQMATARSNADAKPISAVTIDAAAPQLQYGIVAFPGGEKAADALRAALTSQEGRTALRAAGFHTSDGAPTTPAVPGMDVSGTPMTTPTNKEFEAVQTAWTAVHRTMRMIAAIDVSGSMAEKATPTLTRIQVASGAAAGALAKLPGDTVMGVWVFSTNRGPHGEPWAELAPMRSLDTKVGDRTQRDVLRGVAASFPSMPAGGTDLYGTILAAVRRVQEGYDPTKVNSAVVFTDGVNRDAATMTEAQLLAALQAEATSAKPVRVVLVGMGKDSDIPILQKIAAASGGTAYNAYEPGAIDSIITGALTARVEEASSTGG